MTLNDSYHSKFDPRKPLKLNAKYIGVVYSAFTALGIAGTLLIALCLRHTSPTAKSNIFGYKHEWFLPVSLITNYTYKERSYFQIFNAISLGRSRSRSRSSSSPSPSPPHLTSTGPKFILTVLWYLLMKACNSNLSTPTLIIGISRTITQALFVFVPPEDSHELHDTAKFINILLTAIWISSIIHFKNNRTYLSTDSLVPRRIAYTMAFLLIPLTHYYTQHRIYQIPNTYSLYSLFDWLLVFFDVAFEYTTSNDLQALEIRIINHQPRKSKVVFNV